MCWRALSKRDHTPSTTTASLKGSVEVPGERRAVEHLARIVDRLELRLQAGAHPTSNLAASAKGDLLHTICP